MSFAGVSGVMNAYSFMTAVPSDVDMPNLEPGAVEAVEALVEVATDSSLMIGLHVANLLASGLLIIGSVLLTARRRSALWWTRQALFANVAYTLANAGGTLWFAYEHQSLVDEVFVQQGQPAGGPTMLAFSIGTSCGAILMLGLYAFMMRAAARDDVRGFVTREAS